MNRNLIRCKIPVTTVLMLFCILSTAAFTKNAADTTFYYFTNGSISMYETPWLAGRKTYEIFNCKGKSIYRIENTHQSFTVFTTFTFHDNGAVNTALTRTNPDASIYTYESRIQFDRSNSTLSMQNTQTPQESVVHAMGETYLWHSEKIAWIKQEVIRCAPVTFE